MIVCKVLGVQLVRLFASNLRDPLVISTVVRDAIIGSHHRRVRKPVFRGHPKKNLTCPTSSELLLQVTWWYDLISRAISPQKIDILVSYSCNLFATGCLLRVAHSSTWNACDGPMSLFKETSATLL